MQWGSICKLSKYQYYRNTKWALKHLISLDCWKAWSGRLTTKPSLKLRINVPLCGESTGDKCHWWIPHTKDEQCRVSMSWSHRIQSNFMVWWSLVWSQVINSSPLSVEYTHQWTGPSLVQVIACRLFGAKPLPEPIAGLLSSESLRTKFNEILIKIHKFS